MFSNKKDFLSIQNNKIILPDPIDEKEKEIDIYEYLFKTRFDNSDTIKYEFFKYFKNILNDIPNLKDAIHLTAEIIEHQGIIGLIGDYDVDGTSATSILIKFFQHVNKYKSFSYEHHIPNRFSEGYGPSLFSVNLLHKKNVNLIITLDSGSTSYKEIELANDLKIKTIVLDHHLIQSQIPNCTCFVNVQYSENFKYLCGGGLAFVFIYELNQYLLKKLPGIYESFDLKKVFDLVAISTICDFVPLIELNRTLVYYGMKIINYKYLNEPNNLNKGLHMILEYAFYNFNKNTNISSVDIGFIIGPYLNVAGRLEDANQIVDFLTNEDQSQLELLFFNLQTLWNQRKKIQEDTLLSIDVFKNCKEEDKFIYVWGQIHEGIMGIISAKLKDKYNKPAIVISVIDEEMCKGSIRSISPFNAGELIEKGLEAGYLIKGGGHEAAGGFSLLKTNLDKFYRLCSVYMENIEIKNYKEYYIDHLLSIQQLDQDFYNKLQKIGPFGVGNKEFLFLFPFLVIEKIYLFANKHLNLTLLNITTKSYIKAVWFFPLERVIELLTIKQIVHLVGYLKFINNKIEIYLVDIILNE